MGSSPLTLVTIPPPQVQALWRCLGEGGGTRRDGRAEATEELGFLSVHIPNSKALFTFLERQTVDGAGGLQTGMDEDDR